MSNNLSLFSKKAMLNSNQSKLLAKKWQEADTLKHHLRITLGQIYFGILEILETKPTMKKEKHIGLTRNEFPHLVHNAKRIKQDEGKTFGFNNT